MDNGYFRGLKINLDFTITFYKYLYIIVSDKIFSGNKSENINLHYPKILCCSNHMFSIKISTYA